MRTDTLYIAACHCPVHLAAEPSPRGTLSTPLQIRTYKDSLATVAADLKRAKERFSRSALMAGAAGSTGGRPLDFDKSA